MGICMKIGLFGGTFDPPHNAHLAVAKKACSEFSLDRIIFIPAGDPPHKKNKNKTKKEIRLKMTELAISAYENFSLSDYEIKKDKPSYSLDTIKHFKKLYPNDELYFIIGGDSFADLPSWWGYRELMGLCVFIVLSRPDTPKDTLLNRFDGDEKPPRVFYSESIYMDISSTEIRDKISGGKDISNLVPKAVLDYIKSHSLYGYDEIYKQELQKNLKEKRYEHCLNVAQSAKELARIYGADEQKAYTAGLLHDITKELDAQTQLKLCDEFGIIMSGLEKNAFKLWHAMTGAYYVKNVLKIKK